MVIGRGAKFVRIQSFSKFLHLRSGLQPYFYFTREGLLVSVDCPKKQKKQFPNYRKSRKFLKFCLVSQQKV